MRAKNTAKSIFSGPFVDGEEPTHTAMGLKCLRVHDPFAISMCL